MNQEQLQRKLIEARQQGRLLQLSNELRETPSSELFEALFAIVADAQWDGPTLDAAYLLLEREPVCPLSCEEAVQALLTNWDPSLEEVPCYLVTQFGKHQLRKTLNEMRECAVDEGERQVMETLLYWIGFSTLSLAKGFYVRKDDLVMTYIDAEDRRLDAEAATEQRGSTSPNETGAA